MLRNHQKTHIAHHARALIPPRVRLKKTTQNKRAANLMALMAPDGAPPPKVSPDAGKIFKCSICKEAFPSRGAISAHSKEMHSDSKPFQCGICGLGFTRRGTLRIHEEKHKLKMSETLP